MRPAPPEPVLREITRRSHPLQRLKDLFRYRDLLRNCVRKELKVRYKNSILGFFWSMLNPALYLVVFSVVFTVFLRTGIPQFPIYLLSGLLAWNLFAAAMSGASGSIVSNANLVTKVYFPREILPLSALGAALIHFLLQFVVLAVTVLVLRYPVDLKALALVPLALVVEVLVLTGLCLLWSACNVYFRDLQHLLELLLLAWFWLTPIVYPVSLVYDRLSQSAQGRLALKLYLANPMTSVVMAFQRGVYGKVSAQRPDGTVQRILVDAPLSWYLSRLAYTAAAGLVLLVFAWFAFSRLEEGFAEEI
ncbi:MAG TPA: ABC transporter permease [Actinomycetota bacterium]|nr:ABC transporter permease [Actinomycetota bacterium]